MAPRKAQPLIENYFDPASTSCLSARTRSKENVLPPARSRKRKASPENSDDGDGDNGAGKKKKGKTTGDSKSKGQSTLSFRKLEKTPAHRGITTSAGLPTPNTMAKPGASASTRRPVKEKSREIRPPSPPQTVPPVAKRAKTTNEASATSSVNSLPTPQTAAHPDRRRQSISGVPLPETPTKHGKILPRTSSSPSHAFSSPGSARWATQQGDPLISGPRTTPQSQRIVPSSQVSNDARSSPVKLPETDDNPFVSHDSRPVLPQQSSSGLKLPTLPSQLTQSSTASNLASNGSSGAQFKVPPLPMFTARDPPAPGALLSPRAKHSSSSSEVVPSSQSQYLQWPPSPVAAGDMPLTTSRPNTPSKRYSQSQGHSQSQFEPSSQFEELELSMATKLDPALFSLGSRSANEPGVADDLLGGPTAVVHLSPSTPTKKKPPSKPLSPLTPLPCSPARSQHVPSSQTELESPVMLSQTRADPLPVHHSPPKEQMYPQKSDGSATDPESDGDDELVKAPLSYRQHRRQSSTSPSPSRRAQPTKDKHPDDERTPKGKSDDAPSGTKATASSSHTPGGGLRISRDKLRRIANLPNSLQSEDLDFMDEANLGFAYESQGSSLPGGSYLDLDGSLPSAVGDFLDILDAAGDDSQF